MSLYYAAACQAGWSSIVSWPGNVLANTPSADTISLVEMFATIGVVIGEPLPAAGRAAEDSFNIFPALLGQSSPRPLCRSMILRSVNGNFALR